MVSLAGCPGRRDGIPGTGSHPPQAGTSTPQAWPPCCWCLFCPGWDWWLCLENQPHAPSATQPGPTVLPLVCTPPAPLVTQRGQERLLGLQESKGQGRTEQQRKPPRALRKLGRGGKEKGSPWPSSPLLPHTVCHIWLAGESILSLHLPAPKSTGQQRGGQEVSQTWRGWFARRWHPRHSPRSSAVTGSGSPSPSAGSGSRTGPRCCRSRTPAKTDREHDDTRCRPPHTGWRLSTHPTSHVQTGPLRVPNRKGHRRNEHVLSHPMGSNQPSNIRGSPSIQPLQHPSPPGQTEGG